MDQDNFPKRLGLRGEKWHFYRPRLCQPLAIRTLKGDRGMLDKNKSSFQTCLANHPSPSLPKSCCVWIRTLPSMDRVRDAFLGSAFSFKINKLKPSRKPKGEGGDVLRLSPVSALSWTCALPALTTLRKRDQSWAPTVHTFAHQDVPAWSDNGIEGSSRERRQMKNPVLPNRLH